MPKPVVAIVRYEKPQLSVQQAISLSDGFNRLSNNSKVFIKPNIVFWTRAAIFPKWGVITTSRVVHDTVVLLKEYGVGDIAIGEGMIAGQKDIKTPAHAFDYLGYTQLQKRYGVKIINVMERPFEKVDLGDEIVVNFNTDILHSDFVINLPVLKTHVQTVVSLGIKNLKGTIDMASRKKCHSADPVKDLHFRVARLADKMPDMLTLIDGLYTNERGPGMDGRIRRKNLLVASTDVIAADEVGSRILGYTPDQVPHLTIAAANHNHSLDLSQIELKGESLDEICEPHAYDFEYGQAADGSWMPKPLVKQGLEGVSYRKFDTTMCTYCSIITGLVLTAIRAAWRGKPWDKVEILTGKSMQPTAGMHSTILLGQCMYRTNRNHPNIKRMFAVKGCPPKADEIVDALHQAGIDVDRKFFEQAHLLPGLLMDRYKEKPEFEEALFQVT